VRRLTALALAAVLLAPAGCREQSKSPARPGAYCKPIGATAEAEDGTPLRCQGTRRARWTKVDR
jgi:hypothetical protein